MPEYFEVIGAKQAAEHYAQRAYRAGHPAPGLKTIYPAIEKAEAAIFESYAGKYVDTGDLKASLTQPDAAGALREAHGETAEFGSDIWYAVFQGTTGVGRHGPPSAILRMPEIVRHGAAEAAIKYIVEGRAEEAFASLI